MWIVWMYCTLLLWITLMRKYSLRKNIAEFRNASFYYNILVCLFIYSFVCLFLCWCSNSPLKKKLVRILYFLNVTFFGQVLVCTCVMKMGTNLWRDCFQCTQNKSGRKTFFLEKIYFVHFFFHDQNYGLHFSSFFISICFNLFGMKIIIKSLLIFWPIVSWLPVYEIQML